MKKYLFLILIVLGATNVSSQLKSVDEALNELAWTIEPGTNISKGWCETDTKVGKWENYEKQYLTSIYHLEHKWVYDEKKAEYPYEVYACINCCSTPDYPISQKRVCELCGLLQIKNDWVEHHWVYPPKSRYEQIIDSLKGRQ